MQQPSLQELRDALEFVDPNMHRDDWVLILMGIKSEFGDDGKDIADSWSAAGSSYDKNNFKSTWTSISAHGATNINTVFAKARENGYKPEKKEYTQEQKIAYKKQQKIKAKERAEQEAIAQAERQRWHEVIADFSVKLLTEFTIPIKSNKYLSSKNVESYGLNSFKCGVVAIVNNDFTTKTIIGADIKPFFDALPKDKEQRDFSFLHIHRGDLAIPLIDIDKKIWNIQVIKASAGKFFLKHGRKSGCFNFIGDADSSEVIAEAEGYATAASIHKATGWFCIYAFDAGNLLPVAKAFRPLYPNKPFLVCADNDIQTAGNPGVKKATATANAVNGLVVIPDFSNVVNKDAA